MRGAKHQYFTPGFLTLRFVHAYKNGTLGKSYSSEIYALHNWPQVHNGRRRRLDHAEQNTMNMRKQTILLSRRPSYQDKLLQASKMDQ